MKVSPSELLRSKRAKVRMFGAATPLHFVARGTSQHKMLRFSALKPSILMDNTTSTPLDADITPNGANTPPMATTIETPSSVTNGHTPPPGEPYGDGATPTDLNASIEGKGDGKGSWTPGFRAKTAPERALKWDRYFTQPGQDAFDTIDWEMRSAGITGRRRQIGFRADGLRNSQALVAARHQRCGEQILSRPD